MREDYSVCSICGKYRRGKYMNDFRDLCIYKICHHLSGNEFKLDSKNRFVCWDCRNKMKKVMKRKNKKDGVSATMSS